MLNEGKIYREVLPCTLTSDETRARGEEAAKIQGDIERVQEQKTAAAADFKAQIETLADRRAKISREIRERQEFREVDTIVRRNEVDLSVETVRVDTGELVRDRPMSESEKQLTLLPKEEGEAEAAES